SRALSAGPRGDGRAGRRVRPDRRPAGERGRMIAPLDAHAPRPVLALSLELSHGRPGASARVEIHDTVGDPAAGHPGTRIARVALAGCIDATAAQRLH